MKNMIVNVGHRDYGFKDVFYRNPAIVEEKTIRLKKYLPLIATAGVATAAFLALGCDAVSANPVDINIKPVEDYTMTIYWTGFKVLLWVSIPFYGWCAYTFAFSGPNAAKRTAAKVTAMCLVGGTALYAAAPWIGHAIYDASKTIFEKYIQA